MSLKKKRTVTTDRQNGRIYCKECNTEKCENINQKPGTSETKPRNIKQQEGIHTYALGEPYINAERQQFAHPQLLAPDDDHFGGNMS
jgi:hypothetical protein